VHVFAEGRNMWGMAGTTPFAGNRKALARRQRGFSERPVSRTKNSSWRKQNTVKYSRKSEKLPELRLSNTVS
jgi:hypothetical protein